MTDWSGYPQAILKAKARLAALEKQHPGLTESVEAFWFTFPGADGRRGVEGVDNTPEAIEQIRAELAEHRDRALGLGEMQYAVLMSHVIVLLAEMKEMKEAHRCLPEAIKELKEQAQKDVGQV